MPYSDRLSEARYRAGPNRRAFPDPPRGIASYYTVLCAPFQISGTDCVCRCQVIHRQLGSYNEAVLDLEKVLEMTNRNRSPPPIARAFFAAFACTDMRVSRSIRHRACAYLASFASIGVRVSRSLRQ
eukprot:643131-Rhodomonas_salina.5